jgi:hypothetical protein
VLLPGLALLGVLWGLVRGRLEVGVAEAATPASRDGRPLAGRDQVRDEGAAGVIDDGRSRRHLEEQVLAGLAVAARLRAAAAGLGLEVVAVLEVAERGQTWVDANEYRAATTAVAAVWAAARHVRLLAEGRGPVTTIAGTDPDLHAVEEHRGHCPMRSGRDRSRRIDDRGGATGWI